MNLRRQHLDAIYYRLDNNHIFIQLRENWMEYIKLIENSSNQRVHIFELNPLSIPDCIKYIIEKVTDTSKVIIHIPKQMKDTKKYLEHILSDETWEGHNKHWKVVGEGRPVSFTWRSYLTKTVSSLHSFSVKFEHDTKENEFRVYGYLSGQGFQTLDSIYYNWASKGCPIDTKLKANYPEFFKDDIITRFKKLNPKKMLASFKDDNDIWEYLTSEYWE